MTPNDLELFVSKAKTDYLAARKGWIGADTLLLLSLWDNIRKQAIEEGFRDIGEITDNAILANSPAENLLLEYIIYEYSGEGTTKRLTRKTMELVSDNRDLQDLVNNSDWLGVRNYQFNKGK